jgi:transcriptional regulator with XRE-family HTH domain
MYLSVMDMREQQKAWLRSVLERTGLKASALAGQVGVKPTTLTRFLNDQKYSGRLSLLTITAIERVTGVHFN